MWCVLYTGSTTLFVQELPKDSILWQLHDYCRVKFSGDCLPLGNFLEEPSKISDIEYGR